MTFLFSKKHTRPAIMALALTVLILPLILSACTGANPVPATPDANTIGTAAAQTLEAGGAPATITALSGQLAAQSTAMFATQQAFGPTLTALSGSSSTPAATGAVSTPGANVTMLPGATTAANPSGLPTISVSADTNCRQGPSTSHPLVGLLKVGASTTVHGKDSSGQWYYVASPGGGGAFCWLWGQYATLQGNTAGLEVVQAPPAPAAPTPSTSEAAVSIGFENVHSCGGDVATVRVDNTGGVAFVNARVTVRNQDTGEVLGQSTGSNPFLPTAMDCPPGSNTLNPGDTAYLVGPLDATPPAGTTGRVVVLLCPEAGFGGDCQEVRVNFEFP